MCIYIKTLNLVQIMYVDLNICFEINKTKYNINKIVKYLIENKLLKFNYPR